MDVRSTAMSFVVEPLTFVDVAISVNEASLVVCHVACPVALILRAILPDLDASALAETIRCPLSLVDSAVIEFIRASRD